MKMSIILSVLIVLASVSFGQEKVDAKKGIIKTDTVKPDSTSSFLISGRAFDLEGNPVTKIDFSFGEKGSFVVGEGGIVLNPSVTVDENGNFHLKVNKLLLSKYEYKFILGRINLAGQFIRLLLV